MKRFLFLLALLLTLSAHDLFLKTDRYFLRPNERGELSLFNGTFDQSENAISRDRMINSRIIGPDYTFVPSAGDWYDEEEAAFLRYQAGKAGTYAAGVSTRARNIELSAADFNAYLAHDGVLDILERRKAQGRLDEPATESYAKHVKALLQVGQERTDHYATVFGYPVEFVPLSNPYAAAAGDRLTFRLLQAGEPLPGQLVYFDHRAPGESVAGHHHDEASARTDANGAFTVVVDHAGTWYLRTIHMVESEEEGLDYISNWATLTFAVR